MESVVYVGLSRQMALRREMDVTANNLANLSTTAFKREQVAFREYVLTAEGVDAEAFADTSFVQDYGVSRVILEGDLIPTGNTFDLAIAGPGFFTVAGNSGETLYSRNGQFALSPEGVLVNQTGNPVLDISGSEIQLSSGDTNIAISEVGQITSSIGPVAQINIVHFDDEQTMRKVGDGLFSTDQPELPAPDARIRQGVLEGSNVEPIMEITRMVQIVRAYQSTSKLLEQVQELERKAAERLGQAA